jgi:hypothetical protein
MLTHIHPKLPMRNKEITKAELRITNFNYELKITNYGRQFRIIIENYELGVP